ncbi:MAG: DNA polymerase III subunit alpha [Candidatus Marinimicrobia bacterium]|nr:DNA polymerase III subunit alpha [Candidatus Neomarinimicrobiota bacterium]
MSDFIHLHNHSDYSLLDAAQTVETMCNRVADLGMDSIAITEHGNLFSMIPFYKAALKAGIKPILGCEMYVAVNKHTDRQLVTLETGKRRNYYHLVLLAANQQGYKNLLALTSIGYLNGFYYRPRIDKELLEEFNEGLIATSACLAGEVTSYAASGDYEAAKQAALSYQKIFNKRFYIELQNHNLAEEKASHQILKKLSKELNIPLIATNDCHYCLEEHSNAHDVLFCLGTGKDRDDINRLKYEPNQFYIKSTDEMYEIFKDTPEALENTLAVSEQCDVEIPLGKYHLPAYPLPNEETDPDKYLEKLCNEGLKKRYSKISKKIQDRLKYELSVIKKMGYAGYFLITQDFVNYAATNNIPVGPGRGSAAGSIVAYCTGITNIDPLKYNLLFERFLNPERVTMPDIDIDFCIEGREQVINYIKEKYGYDSVAQIITFGTMKAKSVVRDVGRVLGISYSEVDKIAKLIPNEPKITLEKALKQNSELKEISSKSKVYEELIEYSKVLEGCHRHASTHAAGVVIAPGPLRNYVSLFQNPSNQEITTQADMNALEELGLLKMDFLGLRNLTVIKKTIDLIKERHNKSVDINTIDCNDANVYKAIFQPGVTVGIFQFESDGMRENLLNLKPTCFEDLIVMNALYRPGPMSNIPEYIARKHGNSQTTYIHSSLEEILKETYGIIVYQEQVMQICSDIGGFSLGEADIVRRAMGKKKKNLMASYKLKFVDGAEKNNINNKQAVEIFELLEKFAEYGFVKSHSAAYAMIAFHTAWLKTYYPIEFLTANISSDINDTDRIVKLILECKRMNININAPNINVSNTGFSIIDDNTIQYGLSAIKNIGKKASDNIIAFRKKNNLFKSIFDVAKIKPPINKKVLESLILCGACDDLSEHRSEMFSSIDIIVNFINKYNKTENIHQSSLFSSSDLAITTPGLIQAEKWSKDECLKYEKDLLGFYLSDNPLLKYSDDLGELLNKNFLKPPLLSIAGIISDVVYRFDKNGNKWALVSLDTLTESVQLYVFNETFLKYDEVIKKDQLIYAIGKDFNQNENERVSRIIVNKIFIIDKNIKELLTRNLNIAVQFNNQNKNIIKDIEKLSKTYLGDYSLIIHLKSLKGNSQKVLINRIKFSISNESLIELKNIFGLYNVWLSN